jgi:hypothetical protein
MATLETSLALAFGALVTALRESGSTDDELRQMLESAIKTGSVAKALFGGR